MSNTIAVSGSGSAAAPPDLAIVEVGVDVLAGSVAAARAAAASEMGAVVASLRGSGLEDADLSTTAYNIHPEYDHREGRRLRGYRVSNMVEARIKDMDSVGETIDAAAAAGSDHVVVQGLRFAHQDEAVLAAKARQAAWADASAKAKQLADLADVELGPVVAVAEHRSHAGGPPMRARAMEATMAAPIESGELSISVSLEAEFAIE